MKRYVVVEDDDLHFGRECPPFPDNIYDAVKDYKYKYMCLQEDILNTPNNIPRAPWLYPYPQPNTVSLYCMDFEGVPTYKDRNNPNNYTEISSVNIMEFNYLCSIIDTKMTNLSLMERNITKTIQLCLMDLCGHLYVLFYAKKTENKDILTANTFKVFDNFEDAFKALKELAIQDFEADYFGLIKTDDFENIDKEPYSLDLNNIPKKCFVTSKNEMPKFVELNEMVKQNLISKAEAIFTMSNGFSIVSDKIMYKFGEDMVTD